jgi:hypothetical protein
MWAYAASAAGTIGGRSANSDDRMNRGSDYRRFSEVAGPKPVPIPRSGLAPFDAVTLRGAR